MRPLFPVSFLHPSYDHDIKRWSLIAAKLKNIRIMKYTVVIKRPSHRACVLARIPYQIVHLNV